MSDDLIKQITDMLGQDGLQDNIKGLLSLFGGSGSKENAQTAQDEVPVIKENRKNTSELEDNIEMVRKITKFMEKTKQNNDPKVNLLTAIKPFLNNKRQSRVNNCIKILQMSNMTKYLDEFSKNEF